MPAYAGTKIKLTFIKYMYPMAYNINDGQNRNEQQGFGGIERKLDPNEPLYRAFANRAQQAFEKLKKTSYTGVQRFNYVSKYKGF